MKPASISRPPAETSTARPAPLSPHERSTAVKIVGSVPPPPAPRNSEASAPGAQDVAAVETGSANDAEDDAAVAVRPTLEDAAPGVFDDAAEQAFLGEARERGEVVTPKPPGEVEETNAKALPKLDDLVQQIPAEVRDILEDLFRARFVTVKRFPKKALKKD